LWGRAILRVQNIPVSVGCSVQQQTLQWVIHVTLIRICMLAGVDEPER